MSVSIITPVLNGGPYFRACLESVQAAGPQVEHIVLDGGSTDGSIELAQSFPVRFISQPGTGLTARMNHGYRIAQGSLLGFLGADDILLEGAVDAVVAAHRLGQRRWFVGGLRWIDGEGNSLGDFGAPPRWLSAAAYESLDWSVISILATYFDRDLFSELGGYDETVCISADFELIARALRKEPFHRVARPLALWRRHGENFSVVNKALARREAAAVRQSRRIRQGVAQSLRALGMKLWVNLSNPGWCRRKMTERLRVALGLTRVFHY
ncbi:MAG: glycosyltransferase [Betaproteobacteria bacterium]